MNFKGINDEFLSKCNQSIYLLSPCYNINFLDIFPTNFTISTNNSSAKFNIDLLKETSSVISEFIQNHPDNYQFDLIIDDNENILSKFEQLYHGKSVNLRKEDAPTYNQIIDLLNIKNIPNIRGIEQNCIKFDIQKREFLNNAGLQTFKIRTKQNEYN